MFICRRSVLASLRDIAKRYPDGLPKLDPIEDMGITDDDALRAAVKEAQEAQDKLVNNEGAWCMRVRFPLPQPHSCKNKTTQTQPNHATKEESTDTIHTHI